MIRGVVKTLLDRETSEGTARELSAVEVRKRMDTLDSLGTGVVRLFIAIIAGVMILGELGLNIGPAVAGFGVVGIAVGFGAQSLVRDYLNGALILIENQFSKGDVVTLAGVSGEVEDFSLRRTTLRDLDGVVHTVPNGEIRVASNKTRVWARINLDVTIAYGTDIERATVVVNDVGTEMAADPAWRRRVMEAPHVERSRPWASTGSRSRSWAWSAPRSSGRRAASSASACWRRSRRTASRSRARSASSSRGTPSSIRPGRALPTRPGPPRTTSPTGRTERRAAATGSRIARDTNRGAWSRPRRMAAHELSGGIRERRPPATRRAGDREPHGGEADLPAGPGVHGPGQRHGRPLRRGQRGLRRLLGEAGQGALSWFTPFGRPSSGTCRMRSGSPAAS